MARTATTTAGKRLQSAAARRRQQRQGTGTTKSAVKKPVQPVSKPVASKASRGATDSATQFRKTPTPTFKTKAARDVAREGQLAEHQTRLRKIDEAPTFTGTFKPKPVGTTKRGATANARLQSLKSNLANLQDRPDTPENQERIRENLAEQEQQKRVLTEVGPDMGVIGQKREERQKEAGVTPPEAAKQAEGLQGIIGPPSIPTGEQVTTTPSVVADATKELDQVLGMSEEDRLVRAGIKGKDLELFNALFEQFGKIKSTGAFKGNVSISNLTPEQVEALSATGMVSQVTPTGERGSPNRNVILKISEDKFNELKQKFDDVKGGKDIKALRTSLEAAEEQEKAATIETRTGEAAKTEAGIGDTPEFDFSELLQTTKNAVTETQDGLTFLGQKIQTDSNIAGTYLPQLTNLQSQSAGLQGAADIVNARAQASLANVGTGAGTIDFVESIRADIKESKDEYDAILEENKNIKLEAARISKEIAEIERSKQEISFNRRIQKQRETNTENEIKNRRVANKLGVAQDTNGLKWMRDELRSGGDALRDLEEMKDLQMAQFALSIGSNYELSVRNTLNEHASNVQNAETKYRNDLAELVSIVNMDEDERDKERTRIEEKRWDALLQLDIRAADNLRADEKTLRTEMAAQKTQQRLTNQSLMNQAFDTLDRFGTTNVALLNTIEQQLIANGYPITPGTFASAKTSKELKALTSDSGLTSTIGASNEIEEVMAEFENAFPNDTPEERFFRAINEITRRNPGDSQKTNKKMNTIYTTANEMARDDGMKDGNGNDFVFSDEVVDGVFEDVQLSSGGRSQFLASPDPDNALETWFDTLTGKGGAFEGDPDGAANFIIEAIEPVETVKERGPKQRFILPFGAGGRFAGVK